MQSNSTFEALTDPGNGQGAVTNTQDQAQGYLTKAEVAIRLRKTIRTIDSWMARGILPYFKIGHSVSFDWEDCQRHLAEHFRVSSFGCNTGRNGAAQ